MALVGTLAGLITIKAVSSGIGIMGWLGIVPTAASALSSIYGMYSRIRSQQPAIDPNKMENLEEEHNGLKCFLCNMSITDPRDIGILGSSCGHLYCQDCSPKVSNSNTTCETCQHQIQLYEKRL